MHGTVRDPFLRRARTFHPLLIGGDPARTPALFALLVEFERRWGVHYAIGAPPRSWLPSAASWNGWAAASNWAPRSSGSSSSAAA